MLSLQILTGSVSFHRKMSTVETNLKCSRYWLGESFGWQSHFQTNILLLICFWGVTGWSTGPRLPMTSSLLNSQASVYWATCPCAHIWTRSCSKRSTNRFRLQDWYHWKSWVKLGASTLFLVQKPLSMIQIGPSIDLGVTYSIFQSIL